MAKKDKNNNNDNTAQGMFGFQQMMEDFYQSDPQDDAGKLQKRTFQADMIQQALTGQQAEQRAAKAQEYEMAGTKNAMDLDLRNQEQLMKTQNTYGQQKMASEFTYQDRFATNEAQRDADRAVLAGNIQQNQTKLEGSEMV